MQQRLIIELKRPGKDQLSDSDERAIIEALRDVIEIEHGDVTEKFKVKVFSQVKAGCDWVHSGGDIY